MALTNFANLTTEQLTVWSRDLWEAARNQMFIGNFSGTSSNSMIQRIKELKKSEKGARAVITLVTDLEGDGVVGDNQLEGNEEAMKSYDQVIQIDQLRHANRHEGRMADQRSVVDFRSQSKDKLSYWLADRCDQLAFLTMSGISYAFKPNGVARVGSELPNLAFAADVTAPSTNRYRTWDGAAKAFRASTSTNADIVVGDVPKWELLLAIKRFMVENYIRPITTDSGIQVYNIFMSPAGIEALKKDTNFLAAWQHAQKRGDENPLFKGTPHGGTNGFYIDGLNIMEYRYVYNTLGAASGSRWGAGGAIHGQRVLACGAQAMGLADIGMPTWVEEEFDYKNSPGISTGKIFGLKKPVFRSIYSGTNEDFGVFCVDTAVLA